MNDVRMSSEAPGFWAEFSEKFDLAPWGSDPDLIVAYDGVIHTMQTHLPADVLVHEQTHLEQQAAWPMGAKDFAFHYHDDPVFRYQAELEAFQDQFRYIKKTETNAHILEAELHKLADELSGPLYGHVVSYVQALSAIDPRT